MKPTQCVKAAVLVAAFAAIGCSKQGGTSQSKASSDVATTKPVTALATGGAETDEKGLGASALAAITGPASFADGQAAYQAKKYSEAMAIFEAYTDRRPGNAWGYYMLGLSSWKSGDFAKSEQAFDKALSIDPRHIKSLVNLSRALIDQKRHDDAIDRLTRAAEIDPDSVEVQRLLGRTYYAQGRTDESEAAYRRALDLNERDVWSMNNLGLLLLETMRAEEALPLFAQAVELRKEVPEFHNNLGMALEHTGRFKAAATAYNGALTADPQYAKAKQNLVRVEAVKSGPEEPFELGAPTKEPVETVEIPVDEKTASR
ncbi:MAG: tetratricopeptide repeat protein [Vicinamibacterales bacterium]